MVQEANDLKETLARACRMLEMVGLLDYSGHISARLPGTETFYIHPMDLARSEVSPDDMIEVDLEGKIVKGEGKTPGELPIHVSVYQHRDDVDCDSYSFALQGEPVPLSEEEIKWASTNTFRPSSITKSWSYYMEKAKKLGVFWD